MKVIRNNLFNVIFILGGVFFSSLLQAEELYTMNDRFISIVDLSPKFRQAVYEAEMENFNKKSLIVDNVILSRYFAAEAKKTKKSVNDLEMKAFKVKAASEAEMKKWYEANKGRIPYPFEKVKNEIARLLMGEKQQAKRKTLLDKLKKKGKFSLLIKAPQAPIFEINSKGFPSKGAKGAKVTIVEFADYQCPHCKAAVDTTKKIMKKYGKKVNLVYMDFPINHSGISKVVAYGAVCADQQKKYWDYHYMAFEKQRELTKDSPEVFAKALKLDVPKFKKCLTAKATIAKVDRSLSEAERLGLSGTPSFFINGQKVLVHDEASFTKELDKRLKM